MTSEKPPPAPQQPQQPVLLYPSTQFTTLRSSLSHTPQYAATTTAAASSLTTLSNSDEQQKQRPAQSTTNSNCRVQFCAPDIVACINCEPILSTQTNNHNEVPSNRKVGPLLLELRQFQLSSSDSTNTNSSFATTRSICYSRSNPSLGSSLSSTCLDVQQVHAQTTTTTDTIRCATGLTTGALCIHTYSPASDAPHDALVAIEYYHAPRHHRVSTSVAWHPRTPNHVAIGLVASKEPSQGGDICCFLWDVEHQQSSRTSTTTARKPTPTRKLSHPLGVESLAWVSEHVLAVGGARTLQLHDLRSNSAPRAYTAHGAWGVHGLHATYEQSYQLASFCRVANEPVKVWDVRRMDAALAEIKVGGGGSCDTSVVSAVRWSMTEPDTLCIAAADAIYEYDTSAALSRPVHVNTIHVGSSSSDEFLLDFCLYPYAAPLDTCASKTRVISELFPNRVVAVAGDRILRDVARNTYAPVAISNRDGRVVHGFGRTLWVGSPAEGPAGMERMLAQQDEDISATIMRRARCQHVAKYSMDTSSNIELLAGDNNTASAEARLHDESFVTKDALLRLWSWIERVESLCSETEDLWADSLNWPAKGLMDAGAWRLIKGESDDNQDQEIFSDSLCCLTFDCTGRRAALTSCGWSGKFNLINVLGECEDLGEYERSAALAIWHGDLSAAVEALERGAEYVRCQLRNARRLDTNNVQFSSEYAETLDLISLCVAGFRGGDSTSAASSIWRRSCTKLLQRDDLSGSNFSTGRAAYLRSMLRFLMTLGIDTNYEELLSDSTLSLCDRVGFACRFLNRNDLLTFLERCIEICQASGDVEGVTITGLEKHGVLILQSYVDRYSDVQTAALVTSRVIFPSDWAIEKSISLEWLDCYRSLLNIWQMWQSRAMFDVDRAEHLRKFKSKHPCTAPTSTAGKKAIASYQGRRLPPAGRKSGPIQADPDVHALVPCQLDARCNYCSSPLGLKSQDTHATQWLSKMKPVLSCCPQCRKPLPRCAICMLSLGALNPYMELTKDRSRNVRGGGTSPGDLSTLANLPFAEWFTWCMRCKHGGHTHHLVGWFANHEACPVSGCDCQCQFDSIPKLNRPALFQRKSMDAVIDEQPSDKVSQPAQIDIDS